MARPVAPTPITGDPAGLRGVRAPDRSGCPGPRYRRRLAGQPTTRRCNGSFVMRAALLQILPTDTSTLYRPGFSRNVVSAFSRGSFDTAIRPRWLITRATRRDSPDCPE